MRIKEYFVEHHAPSGQDRVGAATERLANTAAPTGPPYPHLCPLVAVCSARRPGRQRAPQVFLVTQLLPGGELLDVVLERERLSEEEAHAVMHRLLSGLDHMHARQAPRGHRQPFRVPAPLPGWGGARRLISGRLLMCEGGLEGGPGPKWAGSPRAGWDTHAIRSSQVPCLLSPIPPSPTALPDRLCRGIAHRDIKPENLLLAVAGDLSSVTIADFGLAAAAMGTPGGEGRVSVRRP